MRSLFILISTLFILYSCSKEESLVNSTNDAVSASTMLKSTNTIKGVNWADGRDNFQSGWLLPSGISSSDSYSTIKSHAQTICSNFASKLGANTVRIPINPPTVMQWWSNYKGVIDGALAQGFKVIIACWVENGSVGYVTNWTNFMSMWTTVINAYGSNGNCYFEILNEPHGYGSTNDLLNMYSSWLSTFSSVPRGRVLCGGTGYSENINNIGGDSRISNCLLSVHNYAYWANYNTNSAWYNDLNNRCGNYTSRTVVTEAGCTMNSGLKFYGVSSTNNEVCFFQGMTNYTRAKSMGFCYWPGLRDGDSYSMTTRNSNYSLNVVNSDAVNQLKWGWGQ
jgi:endoglucanase